ncbi:MAG: hypothetical protein OEM41_05670 [Ignavibacteria bacterium]|nr:hypothetical protein [Ignavibacteria bacterium]
MNERQNLTTRLSRIVPAAVYAGAGLLVLIVGLRGLGNISSFVPQIFLGLDGRLSPTVVGIGLTAEFILLMLMAYVIFSKSRDSRQEDHGGKEAMETATHLMQSTGVMDRKVEALVGDLAILGQKFERLIESEHRLFTALNDHVEAETSVRKNLLERIDDNTESLKEVQHTMQRVFRITSA